MSRPIIQIIGSLNTDLITRTSRIPEAGETLISQSFDTGSGGKGANQAVACARLSRRKGSQTGNVNVRMVGAVGNDSFGKDLIKGLTDDGINVDGVIVKEGEKSGVAVIIVDEQTGENRILMSPNANYGLRKSEFDFESLPAPLPDLIVLQLEIPVDVVLQILNVARAHKIETLLNPAPAQKLPREAWAGVTHLIVNESEANIITSQPPSHKPSWTKWGDHIEGIISLDIPHVTITLGEQGVVYLDTREQKVWQFPAEIVDVVDTTAAGDTFVGAYAAAVVNHTSVPSAVRWANAAAAKTVQRPGAQAAIPWLDEVGALNHEPEDDVFLPFELWEGQ